MRKQQIKSKQQTLIDQNNLGLKVYAYKGELLKTIPPNKSESFPL